MTQFFKSFLESQNDAKETLKDLPKSHRNLLRGFAIKFQPTETLKGDKDHIGKVETDPKQITVAAPWFYPRQFAFIHEIAHLVWQKYVQGTPLQEKWNRLCSKTKGKMKQNYEEVFCNVYACTYGRHKLEKHHHPQLEQFILDLPK